MRFVIFTILFSPNIEHIACYYINTLKIVNSRRSRATDAVAAAGVCIVGRRSSTAPAVTTVDGDAVAVQSTSRSRPNYAGQRGSNTQAYIGIGIGSADIATAISDIGAKPVSVVL